MKRAEWTVVAMLALAACSESHDRTPGSQTHFVSCDENSDCSSLGDGFSCWAGRCRDLNASEAGHDAAIMSVDSGTNTSTAEICDGSDDIRLGLWNDGGQVDVSSKFTNPFGFSFAFVDGHCRYYASVDTMTGIASGMLDATDAASLARDIGYAQIAKFSQHYDQGCPDAGASRIGDGAHAFGCSCGCDDDAPTGLAEAEAASHTWIERFAKQGKPLGGAVRVAAVNGTVVSSPMPLAWPLDRAIADFVIPGMTFTVDSGLVIDDAMDAAALRTLRSRMAAVMPGYAKIAIMDGALSYTLFVRDELPPDVDAAAHTFQMSSVQP